MGNGQFHNLHFQRKQQQPDLSPEQAALADSNTLPTRAVQPENVADQPDLPPEQAVLTNLDTLPTRAIQPIPSSNLSDPTQPQRYAAAPGTPGFQPSIAGQETLYLPTMADYETGILPITTGSLLTHDKARGNPLKRVANAVLTRLQEPQPEGPQTRGVQVVRLEVGLGLAPLLAITDALGLLLVSISYTVSVAGYPYPIVEICCLSGLLLLTIPNLVRLLSRTPTRPERLCCLAVLAFCSFFVQFMTSPLHFSGFDEFLHWRTADDILRTAHLFSQNSMLPVSPYYPGLEIITNAISTTTGLNTFIAGNIIIVTARLLMGLALYLFYEHLTNSSRMASIATLIYATNPHFFFFDSLYNYETLALPLATVMIYILVRFGNTDKTYQWLKIAAWVMLAAITISHHMTDYFFDGLLFLWAGTSFFRPVARSTRIHLLVLALFGLLAATAYALFWPGNPVWSYLSQYFGPVFAQLQQIITRSGTARHLFTSSVQVAPLWDRLLILGAVILVTFSMPFGLLIIQRLYRNNVLAVVFGLISLGYPLTQAFRFTSFGTEITDRSAAFLFLPIAFVLTVLITHLWPTRGLRKRTMSFVTCLMAVLLLGGVTVGGGPDLVAIPGPYLVVADARSVEPEGIATALWSLEYLGPDNRIATDRINQMLMSTYGDQRIITRLGDNIDIAPIFYSAQLDDYDISLLQEGKIRYLVVDTRISTALPVENTYFENDQPTQVISKTALLKFNSVAQINRLFDAGDIVIYDTGAFTNGSGP